MSSFNIETLKKEYEQILSQINKSGRSLNWEEMQDVLKRKGELEKILEVYNALQEVEKKIKESQEILEKEKDIELISLAEKEIESLTKERKELEEKLEKLLKKEREKEKGIDTSCLIMEIRAGVGGEEAALFATDLFNMYTKYIQSKGWKINVLDSNRTDLGGLKQIIFEVKGDDVYNKLKYEGGVHRVQRIPETEKSGRIHTSTASVAILPKPSFKKILINPADLKIETMRASGAGGQYVNKTESAVRVTHIPTGIVVKCQSERSQLQNKENALKILESKLLEYELSKQLEKISKERREQIKKGERADKIRTYNFPQDRVTDHRIQKSWYGIGKIIDGDLDHIIEELEKSLQ